MEDKKAEIQPALGASAHRSYEEDEEKQKQDHTIKGISEAIQVVIIDGDGAQHGNHAYDKPVELLGG